MLTDHLIINLLFILAVAWPMGALFVRLGLPVMLGQLVTGLLLGPAVFNIVSPSEALTFLADLGIFFAMISALVMATAAELAGLHTVIGAFLAGQFVRKEIMHENIYNAIGDRFYGLSYGFLMPVFFASLAFHIHFQWNLSFLLLVTAITVTAIVGKLVGCGIGALSFRYSRRESTIIGFGMNGRGAVELVIVAVVIALSNDLLAQEIISDPLLTEDQFSALVLMAFITTLLAPLMLRWSVIKTCSGNEKEQFCQLWSDKKRD